MTGQEALRRGIVALRAAGVEDPEVESRLLLRHALQQDRTFLYLHLPDELNREQETTFMDLLRRRCQRNPAAYLTGVREFYGIELYVAPGVLIPRPETELLVEQSLRLLSVRTAPGRQPVFVDVGTGSGAVAIAVAKSASGVRCFATDISTSALQVAAFNAKRPRLAGRIEFLQGDLLAPVPTDPDVVAANLPYVPTDDWHCLAPEIRDHEPREALDGGADGLDAIRRLIAGAPERLAADGALLLEVGDGQAASVLDLMHATLPNAGCYALCDLAGIARVVIADLGSEEAPSNAVLR